MNIDSENTNNKYRGYDGQQKNTNKIYRPHRYRQKNKNNKHGGL